jgi:4-amino-4-deoxy-L-arabinose transferase-like glycosyltransferase
MEGARKLTDARQLALSRASWTTMAVVLLLGGVALLPRVLGLADFMTVDEVYNWTGRVERFSAAIASRQWAATVLVGHPGITLCWLASLGLSAERFAAAHGWVSVTSQVEYLRWLRLPLALLEGMSVPAAYLLLRRLLLPRTALIAALLWATSPYLVAHSRLLHLDALLTTFVTFSILCLLIGFRPSIRRDSAARPLRWVVASGCFAGLALLTKGPALILLPSVGLLMIADCRLQIADFERRQSAIYNLQSATLRYALWLSVAALTFTLLWPAMWVDPGHALRSFVGLIFQNGGRPNGDGQFFFGRAIGDPGPLFYIVSDLFRMTPVMLIGLLGAPLALLRVERGPRTKDQGPRTTSNVGRWSFVFGRLSAEQEILLALGAFVLLWTLVMTLGPKKFDRYTLPTWPALLVLSAAGWKFWLWDLGVWLGRRASRHTPRVWPGVRGAAMAGALVLELGTLAYYQPYYLSYYNPLLGGGAAAQRALLVGWGEGMDQVGAYLRTRPDIGQGQIISAVPRTLRPFVPVPVEDVTELDKTPANYAVVYLESIQRGANPAIYATIRRTLPLHRVTIHGIDYAEIYQLPKPFERAIDARFGEALLLRGVTVKREPGHLTVTPVWDVRAQPAANYQAFVHVIDTAGRTVAQIDVAPGGGDAATSAWEPGQQIAVPLPLALPDGLPRGEYQVTFGLYDPKTNQRLPLAGGTPADAARAGPDALLLDTIALP